MSDIQRNQLPFNGNFYDHEGKIRNLDSLSTGTGGGSANFPPGGTPGQFLGKISASDNDVAWLNPLAGVSGNEYRGDYTSLADLQAAYPTDVNGSYATVSGILYVYGNSGWEVTSNPYRGIYADLTALQTAYPTDVSGAYALIGNVLYIYDNGWKIGSEGTSEVVGIPDGGIAKQALIKKTNIDKDVEWSDVSAKFDVLDDQENALIFRDKIQFTSGVTAIEDNNIIKVGVADYPLRPVNISPSDGEQDVTESVVFESTPHMQAFSNFEMYGYQLQIMLASDDSIVYDTGDIESIQTQFRIPLGILQVDTQYKWRVRYQSSNLKWSDWSIATSFQTEILFQTKRIYQPKIVLPKEGQIVNVKPTIVLSEFDATGGLIQGDGEFQIASDSTFSNIIETGTGKNSFVGTVPLSRGERYYARGNHQDSTNTVISPFSPRVSFIIKSLYRETRLGLACDDANQAFTYVWHDENYNQINVDAAYFDFNPIWNLWKAAGVITLHGLTFVRIPAFWMKSGRITREGPLKGWMSWMVDIVEPTQAEKDDGWHIPTAFYNINNGYSDHIFISNTNVRVDISSNLYSANGNVKKSDFPNILNGFNNNNGSNFYISTYKELLLVRLLLFMERGSPRVANNYPQDFISYRGINLFSNKSSDQYSTLLLKGLGFSWCYDLDNAGIVSLNPSLIGDPASNSTGFDLDQLYNTEFIPNRIHLDDYGLFQTVNKTTVSLENSKINGVYRVSSTVSSGEASIYLYNSGLTGLTFSNVDYYCVNLSSLD